MHALVCTRLDILFVMGQVSRHVSNPHQSDWTQIKRVFKYLRRTSTYGIFYGGLNNSLDLIRQETWSPKTPFGYCFLLARRIISQKSKRKNNIALSKLKLNTSHIIWLRNLLKDLGEDQTNPTILNCDNQSAIALVSNPKYHSCMKHIDLHYHFI